MLFENPQRPFSHGAALLYIPCKQAGLHYYFILWTRVILTDVFSSESRNLGFELDKLLSDIKGIDYYILYSFSCYTSDNIDIFQS